MAPEPNVSPLKPPFRICSNCAQCWDTLTDFLSDPDVVFVGYQVNFDRLEAGLFLFNHVTPDCGTTFAHPVGEFRRLYDGPVFKERLTGGAACPGHCLKREMFAVCPAKCECAYVREILDRVNRWPKRKAG